MISHPLNVVLSEVERFSLNSFFTTSLPPILPVYYMRASTTALLVGGCHRFSRKARSRAIYTTLISHKVRRHPPPVSCEPPGRANSSLHIHDTADNHTLHGTVNCVGDPCIMHTYELIFVRYKRTFVRYLYGINLSLHGIYGRSSYQTGNRAKVLSLDLLLDKLLPHCRSNVAAGRRPTLSVPPASLRRRGSCEFPP